jgi:hypothetical protein
MKLLFIILFSSTSLVGLTQALTWESEDLENKFYYPSKKVYIDNNVKYKIDSNINQLPRGYWVEAFDKQGRLIGSFSHPVDSFSNPYKYVDRGDTLLRIRVRDRDATIYMLERFIYNDKGQISQFDRIYDDILDEQLEVSRTVFFYEKDIVVAKLRYSLNKKGELTENFTVDTDSMKLWSAKYYTYKQFKLHSLTIVKENAGKKDFRDIDTFTYDNKNRLISHVNFAKTAYVIHEATAKNVKYVETYDYKNDSVIIKSYWTSSLTHANGTQDQGLVEYEIKIFNKSGLEIKNFRGQTKQSVKPYDRIEYIHYK